MNPFEKEMLVREIGSIVNHRVVAISDALVKFSAGFDGLVVDTACNKQLVPPAGDGQKPMYDAVRFKRPMKGETLCEKCQKVGDNPAV